jgi:hypothetical protein
MFDEILPISRQPLPNDPAADIRAHRSGMAGAEGLEPPTCGFGDRRSTN